MKDIVNRLRWQARERIPSAPERAIEFDAANEIESLRTQLAEVTKERDDALFREYGTTQQLLATQAHAARLLEALKIAQNFCNGLTAEECPDRVAIPINEALSTPINLDALQEALAQECERLANTIGLGDGRTWVRSWMNGEAGAHRSKKGK